MSLGGAAPALRDAQDASDDNALTPEGRGSLARALTDWYGIPWSLSALKLGKLPQVEVSVDSTVMYPTQVFTLTLDRKTVHPLPESAKAR